MLYLRTIYVQNLYFKANDGSIIDYSGAYNIISKIGINLAINLPISEISGYQLVGQPRVSFYRGLQVSIMRVSDDDSTTFAQRYNVTYKII